MERNVFGWFRKKHQTLQPEARWTVGMEGNRITIRDDAGQITSIAKSDLSGVAIETNDSGPWGADVWWLLFDSADEMTCSFPQGATGEDALIAYLSALPSFDHGEMISAMRSTSNAVFPVWRRSA